MKKAIYYTLVVAVICGAPAPTAHAEEAPATAVPHVLITEIQTGGASDATEEFVELYNPGNEPTDITGWLLQYRAASQTATQSWPGSSTKATIACPAGSPGDCKVVMNPQARLVLVHTIANIAGALPMSGGFSASGGEIRLYQPATLTVQDFVGYGTAADSQGAPAPAPAAGKSIKRVVDADTIPRQSGVNAADFIAACGDPTPGQDDSIMVPFITGCAAPAAQTSSDEPQQPTDSPPTTPLADTPPPTDDATAEGTPPPTYLPVLISELLPDPAAPQQDSTDEFIELYNPNETAITLTGYRLQTGADYRYTFTLGDTPLGPHSYMAISSAVSKLSLVNSGSGVRLIDPNGVIAAETPNYGDAKEGQSWMQDDTGWHWSLTTTPNAPNILALPAPKVLAAAATPTKKQSKKPAATTKIAAPKTPKAPAAKKTATTTPTIATQPAAAPATNPPYWVFIPLCCLVVGYAVYEYRQAFWRGTQKIWAALTHKNKSLPEEE